MAKINITCPNPKCKARFNVDGDKVGKRTRCAKCNAVFNIERPQDSPATIPALATQAADHGAQLTVPATWAKASETVFETRQVAATIAYGQEPAPGKLRAAEQAVPLEWEKGQIILDLYEVKDIHEGGGMGVVYRVHHKNWKMDLAVKCPRSKHFQTATHKENFIRECQTWIDLGLHPHIVSCYYVRTLGGIPRVFAEYVEGGSLKGWIDDRRLYEGEKDKALERIMDIAIQFARGLQYAHEKGLIHQDVKPANVMMTSDGIVKITDFGLAKARTCTGELSSGVSQKNILVSSDGITPAYCSPEQANKQSVSQKADIWSWGLSVLEMFSGGVFWGSGQAAAETLESFLQTGPEEDYIPAMPKEMAELLRQCFQIDPDKRPMDMKSILTMLCWIYQRTVGREYIRPLPKSVGLLADGRNNKAVSMLDLGKMAEAQELWDEALRVQPGHPESEYNRLLFQEVVRCGYTFKWQPFRLCQPHIEHVRLEVGNLNTQLAGPDSIVNLGEAGLAAAIRLFREPCDIYGNLNQAVLASALVVFAKRGDLRAQDFLFDVAQGRVPIVTGPIGDAAFEIAQSYVYGF